MPKRQTTAGKKARAAAREWEKYATALRGQLPPGTGPAAVPYVSGTDAAHPVCLEHRSLLDHPPGLRAFRGTDLSGRIGGQPAIGRLVDLLYEGIGEDDQLRPLRGAAAQGSLAMAGLLLAHGADAARIGAGRWVLHPGLAPLLASRGAAIDSSGSWIGASCTGNQGRKDDPEYVRALLHHGARATDRRTGDPEGMTGVRALNATALHYAARAGFLRTIEVLIGHGADPHARDSHGRTPLDWLEQAAPPVSRAAVRNLIAPGQRR